MDVLLRQRKAWVRTGTHTVVFDHDPEFARFQNDTTGELKGLLRLWLVLNGNDADDAEPRYLGACRLCAGHLEWSDLLRLLRRTRLLVQDRTQRREVRKTVVKTLRGYDVDNDL
jgi:hypothetical protein